MIWLEVFVKENESKLPDILCLKETLRGVAETVKVQGLFDSLYTDRGSHYWHTPEAGGKVDKDKPDPDRPGDGRARDRDDRRVLAAGAGPS